MSSRDYAIRLNEDSSRTISDRIRSVLIEKRKNSTDEEIRSSKIFVIRTCSLLRADEAIRFHFRSSFDRFFLNETKNERFFVVDRFSPHEKRSSTIERWQTKKRRSVIRQEKQRFTRHLPDD